MDIGNFFEAAPYAEPVEPKPVKFVCVSSENPLPGGHPNPEKRTVKAKCTACFIFIPGEETNDLRAAALRALRKRAIDPKTKQPLSMVDIDPSDYEIEAKYHMLARAIRQYDATRKKAGEPFFEGGPSFMAKVVVHREMERLWMLWQKYIAEHHPEDAPDAATFRGAEGSGEDVAVEPPG